MINVTAQDLVAINFLVFPVRREEIHCVRNALGMYFLYEASQEGTGTVRLLHRASSC